MQVNESIARDIMRLFVWYPFRWSVRGMPIRLSFLLFKLAGDLHFSLGGEKKKRITTTVQALLDTSEARAYDIVRKYFEIHYLDRLHIFLYPKFANAKRLDKIVCFENIDALDRVIKNGRGALIVQPHFGPVQITLLSLALSGYNPLQIGYPNDKGLSRIGRSVAFKHRIKYEAMLPAPIIPANSHLGNVYRHLTKGGVVLTTGDGAGGSIFLGEHEVFHFLGIERMFPLGPATWALKTNAAFIPTFILPQGHKKFKIIFEDPIEGIFDNIEKDKIYLTDRFIAIAQDYIIKYPHCWHFWDEIQDY
ncbi:MAG: lysophospholipid acyltransferase family protein [Thermodesulfobacteriota bacterium]|nr:lysophospholipid acyltransferase family protein [Thermodesulfobacteriota bacterium]